MIDIGARNGLSLLKALHVYAELHAIEPEAQAAAELKNQKQKTFREVFVHEIAIAGADGEAFLNVTRNGSMSSLLNPDVAEFKRGFGEVKNAPDWISSMDVVKTQRVKTQTLSTFFLQQNLDFADFLKIDTQGNELDILQSGRELLRAGRAGVICAEVALHPIYENQHYFSDVDVFMRGCGYRLVEFRTYAQDVMREDEFTAGEKLYERPRTAPVGDAWYAKDWTNCDPVIPDAEMRCAIVLAGEGYLSEAAYLVGNKMPAGKRNDLFRHLAKFSGEPRLKHFLRRWTPLAIQQWRAKMKRG